MTLTRATDKEQHGNENDSECDNLSSDDSNKDESDDVRDEKKRSYQMHASGCTLGARNWVVNKKFYFGVAIAIFVLSVYYGNQSAADDGLSRELPDEIKRLIQVWRSNYPNQNHETWSTIAGQLMEFVNVDHMSPLVFVMAYDKAVDTTKILASEITRAALQLKFKIDECGDQDVAKISGSDKRIKPGFLLNNYISVIKKCRKMIMYNLEELDGSRARDLHSLIDGDFPNLHKVVYIFTVQVPNVERNVYFEVQDTLRKHWSTKIEDDILNPLLSRLLNNVKIIPEPVFES